MITIQTPYETLFQLAFELGKAKLEGDAEKIKQAQEAHDAYKQLCLKAEATHPNLPKISLN
jgi:hypothetical protein